MSNPNFMNGVPELLILRLLHGREMYGYELVQSIRAATQNEISLGEGVVYPVLHGLERKKAIKSKRREVNGRIRLYYSVTPTGNKHLSKLAADWERISGAVGGVLRGGENVSAAV